MKATITKLPLTHMERIGIIGDVHAEHRRLETALRVLKDEQVDVVLCTGDLADGRGDLDA
ncbi:MAG: metallophosphoesterase, partial [SAR116 cluster bacterium]